jgi:hypothetical protein
VVGSDSAIRFLVVSTRIVTLVAVGPCCLAVTFGVASGSSKDSAVCRISAMRLSVGAGSSEKKEQHEHELTVVGVESDSATESRG